MRATIAPMKKISAAPIRLGMKPMMLSSSVVTGCMTPPRSNTWSTASRPNSQISSETIRPSCMPIVSPLAVWRLKKPTLSTSLAKVHLAALASSQVTTRMRTAIPTRWAMIMARSGSKR